MGGLLAVLAPKSGDDADADPKSVAWKALVKAIKDDDEEAGLEALAELTKPAEPAPAESESEEE